MTEFKPIKEGKVREIYDNGDMYSPNVGLVRTEQYDKNNVLQSYTVLEELK